MTMWTTVIRSPIAQMRAYATDGGIRAILWGDDVEARHGVTKPSEEKTDHPHLSRLAEQLARYFAGTLQEFDISLDPVGTAFQREAWDALTKIPYGETRTYSEQAVVVGRPKAARAVGAANGRNPIPIVVPCHRVIGADGSLTGFAGGLGIKQYLLNHERKFSGAADQQPLDLGTFRAGGTPRQG